MLTKKVTHNRLRPKPSQKNQPRKIKPDTMKDPEFLTWLHEEKKPCCALCHRPYSYGSEIHHNRDKSVIGRDDTKGFMLCGVECHRLGSYSAHGNTAGFNKLLPKDEQFVLADKLYQEYV